MTNDDNSKILSSLPEYLIPEFWSSKYRTTDITSFNVISVVLFVHLSKFFVRSYLLTYQ